MTIRHMKIFIQVYQSQNMTKAADTLYMAQPSVSRTIKEIEDFYGVRLFERINRKIYPTDSARQLYSHAIHIVDSFQLVENQLKNWDEIGTLRIGSNVTIGNCTMPALISDFQKDHPHLHVTVTISNSTGLQQMLCENKLDFAFMEVKPTENELCFEPFAFDEMTLVLPYGHPLTKMENIQLTDLLNYPFLMRESGSACRAFVDRLFAAQHLSVIPQWESSCTQVLLEAVCAGIGISILPAKLVSKWQNQNTDKIVTAAIHDVNLQREDYIVWHKNKFLSNSAKKLIHKIHPYFAGLK